MNGMSSAVAVPNGYAPAQPSAALELRAGQTMWTRDQHAALVAMGIPPKATSAELGVFLHQCQRLRLDPFTKQIYLIYRRVKDGDNWVEKPTTQIGIDGFRVTRDRIAAERGVSVEYEDTVWYDAQGQGYEVWLWDEPPAACKFVVKVDGRRFPSVLRFNEYCQRSKNGDRLGRWRDGHAHQIEKCAEADALRRAFPNDLSGVILEDAAPLSDPDAPGTLPQDRPRISAEQVRERRQTVTAEVVPENVPPAQPHVPPTAAPAPPSPVQPGAGGTSDPDSRVTAGQVTRIIGHGKRLGWGDTQPERDGFVSAVNRYLRLDPPVPLGKLTSGQADDVTAELANFKEGDAQGFLDLINDGVMPDGQ